MTEILNEQICGTIKSTKNKTCIMCEARMSRDGKLMSIIGGTIYYIKDETKPMEIIGSFSLSRKDVKDSIPSIAINLEDYSRFSEVSSVITDMVQELENKYV